MIYFILYLTTQLINSYYWRYSF